MERSIDPRRVTLCQFQWPFNIVSLLGTRVAETILASGHVRPHTKAAHMEASDPIKKCLQKTLASGSQWYAPHPRGAVESRTPTATKEDAMQVIRIGLDLAKYVFEVHGVKTLRRDEGSDAALSTPPR